MKTITTVTAMIAIVCMSQTFAQTKFVTQNTAFTNTRTGTQTEKLSIELRYTSGGIDRSADGVVAVYNNKYSNTVDEDDAEQMANRDEDISLAREKKELSIECRKLIDNFDTLFIKIAHLRVSQADYRWVIKPQNFTSVGFQSYLTDHFTNTITPISLTVNTIINFSVTSNSLSTASNRFEIAYKPTTTLPVTITNFLLRIKISLLQFIGLL